MTIKSIVLFFLIFIYSKSFCQIITLEKEPDKLPSVSFTHKFIDFLNKKYDDIKKENPDSLLLLYIGPDYYISTEAEIFYKKGGKTNVLFIKQFDNEIKNISVNSDTLQRINIYGFYQILVDDFVRTTDTNYFISHREIMYCKFYFGNLEKIYMGYYGSIMNKADDDFRAALVNEKIRTLFRKPENIKEK